MTREDALLLVAAVAPGKYPVADAYFEREIMRLLDEQIAKAKPRAKSNV